MLIDELRKVKLLNMDSIDEKRKYEEIMGNFVSSMNIVDEKYTNYSSYGTGRIADIWWCGIFNNNFYNKFYGLKRPTAKEGYYLVYLFNKEKTKLYLSLNQGAEKISNNKKVEKIIEYINKI